MKAGRRRQPTRCAFGCFIGAGAWAWFGKWLMGRQFIVCRECGETRYAMTGLPEEFDGKAVAARNDE